MARHPEAETRTGERRIGGAAASFRDPAGRVHLVGDRVLRVVGAAGATDLDAFFASPAVRRLAAAGRIVVTWELSPDEARAAGVPAAPSDRVLEHERVPFPSYPYEWPPEMLEAAARLTLDLTDALLAESLGLKDATPYNVLFRGPRPVFVDVLSVERREPRDPIWLAAAQLQRTFLLPLLAARHFALPPAMVFQASRDGIEPETMYGLLGPVRRLRPPFLGLVTLPTWLGRRDAGDPAAYRPRLAATPDRARYVLAFLHRRLRRTLDRVAPVRDRRSAWSHYAAVPERTPELEAKRALVQAVMAEFHPRTVLDVGCNTGYLAAVAARAGARVVAIDTDPVVVGAAWHRAAHQGLDVLPLVVDLTRPSPALGWRNRECPAFLERAQTHGGFDATFWFAVIHHMLVTERVPLAELLELAASLTGRVAVIEFVPPDDALLRRITRGRERLHADLTAAAFEAAAARHFETVRAVPVPGTARVVYLLRKR